ncbi:MbcA/ParS/Xre antitoxin family protein [Brevundimonas sp.]|uniref:MbcA/ParS/Xre antitoxin family protein n=1 Tax=Brevundimonas sp. TaxID=1871086 RepID=UPI0025C5E816|nr:MbcA/ParS/Xre antitoxin family protein [Brevundimonas sp.]
MPQPTPVALLGDGRSPIPVAMEAFTALADAWDISTDDQIKLLGSPGRSTFFKWKKEGGSIPKDAVERISHLLGIYKALQILLPDPTSADEWVKKKNSYFSGQSALEVMLGGQVVDIYRVRQYLDAQRGG